MTIAFFTNFISHHQVLVADELYELTSGSYYYVEMEPMPESYRKSGYPDFSKRPYVVQAWRGRDEQEKAKKLALEVDVMLIGSLMALDYEVIRNRKGGLTFEVSERWFKRGLINALSPNFLRWYYNYLTLFRKKEVYKLCCSAFASYDLARINAFKKRCFKWGYFTKVDEQFEVEAPKLGASTSESTPLMWCARFLRLKHPELPVQLAARLKKEGYKFHLDMFGSGEELERIKALITKLGVDDCVSLRGNLPNEEILQEMRKHSIFLFTSDRNEGWGAVLNEAMSNGCAVVASRDIGSVPYLIKDGVNGFTFKSKSVDGLYDKVKQLIENQDLRNNIRKEAVKTMREIWSPRNAAESFLNLSSYILEDNLKNYKVFEGPASWDLKN